MKREVVMAHILLLVLVVSACLVGAESSSPSSVTGGSSPSLLKKVGRWSRGPVYASVVSGHHVYFGSGGAIRVLKINRKSSTWKEVASIDASGVVRDLYVSGRHLYVADDSGALIIIDISNPKKPKETGRAKLSDYVRAVFVQGNYAYLAAQWAGLVVIDVSKPTQPRVVRTHKTGGIAQDVHVVGSLALVANAYRSNGLRLIDVSNPLQPKDVGHYDMPGIAYGVFAADNFAYVVSLEHDEEAEAGLTVIDISDPTGPIRTGSIALRMKYDGVPALFATVKDGYLIDLASLPLQGGERLSFVLHYYGEDGNWRSAGKSFAIDLAELEFPLSKVGGAGNRLGFIYDDDLSEESRSKYERFLRRLYPLLHANLGPPAASFNVRFDLSERSGTFMSVDQGRRILTNGSFNPRLIAHELIHAWKGQYLISSDKQWRFATDLLGFEEAIAEGGAFVLMQQYVRAYPDDPATIKLLKSKPYQYWSHKSFVYDSINHLPVTGAGDFFADSRSGVYYLRYTIAATTVQLLVEANSDFLLRFHRAYYDTINGDPEWRPNRDDIVALWAGLVDELQGYPLEDFLGSIPVFNGTKLAQGFYFQNEIRPYGLSGDFQFAPIYIRENGKMLWWAYPRDLTGKAALPEWLPTLEVNTEKYGNLIYVDT